MTRPEVLFLAHRIPYPPDKGDKIRSWRLVSHLAKRFDVHLAAFVDDPADFTHQGRLEREFATVALVPLAPRTARLRSMKSLARGEPLTFGYYDDRRMRAAVAKARSRPLAAEIAFSSSMAPYLDPPVAGRPRIADICDADSEKWRDYAAAARGPLRGVYAREHRLLAAAETRIVNEFDAALAISDAEGRLLSGRPAARRSVTTVPNGVDADYFSPERAYPFAQPSADVVFVGAMDYKPNADAVLWFAREVWPLARKRAPTASFAIVGPNPPPDVAGLDGREGISVAGRVADVRPFLGHARLAVAPLKIARGVQNKVLEGMAMGLPVVATSGANAGVGATPGREIAVADAAPEFADWVARLLSDAAAAQAMGAAGRARVIADFTWERALSRFDAVLRGVGLAAAPPPFAPAGAPTA